MPPQSDSTSFGAKNRVDTVLKHLLLINGDEVECVEPPSAQRPKCASDCCLRLARNFYLPPCPFKVCDWYVIQTHWHQVTLMLHAAARMQLSRRSQNVCSPQLFIISFKRQAAHFKITYHRNHI
jgi:hypothetical protein